VTGPCGCWRVLQRLSERHCHSAHHCCIGWGATSRWTDPLRPPFLAPLGPVQGRRGRCACLNTLAARTLGPPFRRCCCSTTATWTLDTTPIHPIHRRQIRIRRPALLRAAASVCHAPPADHVPRLLLRCCVATILLGLRSRPRCHERIPDVKARAAPALPQSATDTTVYHRGSGFEAESAESPHRHTAEAPWLGSSHAAKR
jgi:hypothetical protein